MTYSLKRGRIGLLLAGGIALAIAVLAGTLGSKAIGSETPPVNTALPTVSPTTLYMAQVATANKGTWTGEPTSYSYAWSRCSAKCEAITGATSKKYTPVAADVGKSLTVSVTATNSAGSTTATSDWTSKVKESLNWYRCTDHLIGAGTYEDANCSKVGTNNQYSWLPINEREIVTGSGESGYYTLHFVVGGVGVQLNCGDFEGSGMISDTEARAEVNALSGVLKACTVSTPAGMGCQVSGAEVPFNTLKGVSPQSPQTLEKKLTIEPSSGTVLATFEIVGCSFTYFNDKYSLKGSFPAKIENSKMYTYTTENVNVTKGIYTYKTTLQGESSIQTPAESDIEILKLDVSP